MSRSEYEGPTCGVIEPASLSEVMKVFFAAWSDHDRVHPILGVCDRREPDEECCDRVAVTAVLKHVHVPLRG